jgi:hypothetical protein
MSKGTVRIKTAIRVGYIAGSTRENEYEFPRDEWEALDEAGRQAVLDEYADGEIANHVEAAAWVEED